MAFLKYLIFAALSKLFPYKIKNNYIGELIHISDWRLAKMKEREYFYGGNDRSE